MRMEIIDRAVNKNPDIDLDPRTLGFGKYFTANMFTSRWTPDQGWQNSCIEPYAPFSMDPASLVLHYGQEVFEGLKAFRHEDGSIHLFRPEYNCERLNRSARRLCMPELNVQANLEAMKRLVELEQDWVPGGEGALYLRPNMIATEAVLGVRSSTEYLYYIILSPVGSYFKDGWKPVKIATSQDFVRACKGGMGEAKTAGNYAASLLAQKTASESGCEQVLWLDAQERRYVEEMGGMNVMFVVDGVVCTAPLGGTILSGGTRDSIRILCEDHGVGFEERQLAIDEVLSGVAEGRVTEIFACGTAAVVTPVGMILHKGQQHEVPVGGPESITSTLYRTLCDIQRGRAEDRHNWLVRVV
ncbi:MAG: branched-chain amino acid aminotransferase [Planctomycetota bacterium]|jgi:branched-chain amino acid aminotransferase|nr:branched-chain amino acid aminotransferase [Planctomycetota bacterium]